MKDTLIVIHADVRNTIRQSINRSIPGDMFDRLDMREDEQSTCLAFVVELPQSDALETVIVLVK